MKVIVFSDSHGVTGPMREAAQLHSDAELFLYLGDGCRDFEKMCGELGLSGLCVRGNCDLAAFDVPTVRTEEVGGCRIFLTHGHEFGVKYTMGELISAGKEQGADLILFGHTHKAYCGYEEGIYLMNPGSVGFSSSYGIVQIGGQTRGSDGLPHPGILLSTASVG